MIRGEKALPLLVRRLNHAEPLSRKAREAARERFTYRLDGSSFQDAAGFYRRIAELMTDGTTETGGNLDALNDCLGERRERELIVIQNAGAFVQECGPYGLKLLQVFFDNGLQVLMD